MTLSGTDSAIAGKGTMYREAGTPTDFTVSGSTAGVTFTYTGGSTESFTFAQPDGNHLSLANAQRTLLFNRQ